jgi:RNA polymerase sigma-54 factor
MKLLQIPTAHLEERVKEELEENPALEVGEEEKESEDEFEINNDKDEYEESAAEDNFELDGSTDEYGNIDISEYVSDGDDEVADYKMRDENYPEVEEQKTLPYKVETTFHDLLLNQLGMLSLDEKSYKIAEQVVGSIDDDGYLRRELSSIVDDLAFRQNIEANEDEIDTIIRKIQEFDPPGICARNLKECLLLQLHRQVLEGKDVATAIQVMI